MLTIFSLVILLFSVVIHEVAHGAMANRLGDPTAKYSGRLTLNPLKHLDPIGSVILPIFLALMATVSGSGIIFGWAKPVPINPYNFRDQKYGPAKSALAGPVANLAIALAFGLLIRFLSPVLLDLNLLSLLSYIVYINVLLAVFNLLPIPPLDGSHILFTFLPRSFDGLKMFLSQSGMFLLLLVIFFFSHWLILIVRLIFNLIVGVSF